MSFIFWIFFIFIIWAVISKKNGENSSSSRNTNSDKYRPVRSHYEDEGMRRMQAGQNNSYYSKQKVESYRKMEAAHQGHEDDEDLDITSSIGYVKCPKCGASVSKKSEVCFMCNEPLK